MLIEYCKRILMLMGTHSGALSRRETTLQEGPSLTSVLLITFKQLID